MKYSKHTKRGRRESFQRYLAQNAYPPPRVRVELLDIVYAVTLGGCY